MLSVANSSWGDSLRCGPWGGQNWNHKALHEPPTGHNQHLQFFIENPSRGRLHFHLLRCHAREPAAHWRILQVSLKETVISCICYKTLSQPLHLIRFRSFRLKWAGRLQLVTVQRPLTLCFASWNRDCRLSESCKAGQDDGTALKLWAVSCHLLGIRWR